MDIACYGINQSTLSWMTWLSCTRVYRDGMCGKMKERMIALWKVWYEECSGTRKRRRSGTLLEQVEKHQWINQSTIKFAIMNARSRRTRREWDMCRYCCWMGHAKFISSTTVAIHEEPGCSRCSKMQQIPNDLPYRWFGRRKLVYSNGRRRTRECCGGN